MKIAFIGTVLFSKMALQKLVDLHCPLALVITKKQSAFNADYADMSSLCRKKNVPFRQIESANSAESISLLKNIRPDLIFCIGWSEILGREVLKIPSLGIVGFHPAELPHNRGRHPIIWALVLGLKRTASTFFFMDQGMDSGDIISQKIIPITYNDNAKSLYAKIAKAALVQLEAICRRVMKGDTIKKTPQDNQKTNCWRKRSKYDGQIDFRMGSRSIYNLVRGLTKPYVGAHLIYKNQEIKIWKAKEIAVSCVNLEYGKILAVKGKKILVKCADNAILLEKHEFDQLPRTGEYLL